MTIATPTSAGAPPLPTAADPTTVGAAPPPNRIAPATQRAGWKLVVPFAFAQFTLFVALLGPVMVSMAIKISDLVGPANATTVQGVVLGVGALAALVANPIAGRLSDRTTGRFGRRRPWMVGGAVGLALSLLVVALATSVPVVLVAWFCAQLSANAAFAAYLATVADQIPPRQTATITALGGVMQNVGILGALFLAQMLTADMVALFMVPAGLGVLGMLVYALVLPDAELRQRPPREGWRAFLTTFWVNPLKHPDFAWAWWSRFLLILGTFMFTTFRFNWMRLELGMDDATAVSAILVGTLVYTAALVVCGQVAGIVSDRLGKRKFGVFASVALTAVGLLALTQVSDVSHFYLVEAILGAAYGIYMGVDLALVLAVLPNPDDKAKDLGVFNIANAAPQSVAPFLGAALIAVGAGANFTLLYVAAAVATLLGAFCIIPVKKVK